MPRLLSVLLLLAILAPVAVADQPLWAFEGQLPAIFQMGTPLPLTAYSREGAVLTEEQVKSAMLIDTGDPVVLIRDGAVVGTGTIGEFVALRTNEANQWGVIFFHAAGLPEGVETPDAPPGPSALEDAGYDLYVLTDKPVEVLAPDPAFTDIAWGVHDYCVRVGRLRFAVIREVWPRTDGFRGWQVVKLEESGNLKVHTDYTWQPR